MQLILASQSPRRKELLGLFHIPFTVRVADIDEAMDNTKSPDDEVARVSCRKRWYSRTPNHRYNVVAVAHNANDNAEQVSILTAEVARLKAYEDNQAYFEEIKKKFEKDIRDVLSFMSYAQIVFISAKTGQRLPKLFETIDAVIENTTLRVSTGVLNEIMTEAVAMQQPPSDKGKRLRLYYITQVSVKPPTFVIFVNDKELMHFSYTRYLENRIRETFGFRGTALKFIIRERKEEQS